MKNSHSLAATVSSAIQMLDSAQPTIGPVEREVDMKSYIAFGRRGRREHG